MRLAPSLHRLGTDIVNCYLLEEARRLTKIEEKTALVRAGLEALISIESARRLAALGGTQPQLRVAQRRRPPGRRSR